MHLVFLAFQVISLNLFQKNVLELKLQNFNRNNNKQNVDNSKIRKMDIHVREKLEIKSIVISNGLDRRSQRWGPRVMFVHLPLLG